jgi:hypothetical protein
MLSVGFADCRMFIDVLTAIMLTVVMLNVVAPANPLLSQEL